MSNIEILALLALTGYAIYKQTQRHEVIGSTRFKLAVIYAIVGVCYGGFSRPDGASEWLLLVVGLVLSAVVGLARGRLSRMWVDDDATGRHVYMQGTPLTIALFVGLVAVKFAMGTAAYFLHVSDDGGFGEVLFMIAIMVAFQAEIVWRRAQAMTAATPVTSS